MDRLDNAPSVYWRNKLSGVDIGSIKSVRDISKLPFTEKSDLRDTYPYDMLAISLDDTVRLHASSGTSGKPTVVGYSRRDIEIFAECNARALAIAGVDAWATSSTTPMDMVSSPAVSACITEGNDWVPRWCRRPAVTPPFSFSFWRTWAQVPFAPHRRFACCWVSGRTEAGLHDRLSVRTAILGAEPWSEGMRQKLHEVWGEGFQAVDIYGLSEVMGPGRGGGVV